MYIIYEGSSSWDLFCTRYLVVYQNQWSNLQAPLMSPIYHRLHSFPFEANKYKKMIQKQSLCILKLVAKRLKSEMNYKKRFRKPFETDILIFWSSEVVVRSLFCSESMVAISFFNSYNGKLRLPYDSNDELQCVCTAAQIKR